MQLPVKKIFPGVPAGPFLHVVNKSIAAAGIYKRRHHTCCENGYGI